MRLRVWQGLVGFIVVVLLISGCQSHRKDETAYWYSLPKASLLILHKDLPIPARRYEVYLQRGHRVARDELRIREPYCYFQIEDWSATEQRMIPAGRFLTGEVRRRISYSGVVDIPIAASPWWWFDHDRSDQTLMTLIPLTPLDESPAKILICERFADPVPQNQLSLQEIRGALGDWVTIQSATRQVSNNLS